MQYLIISNERIVCYNYFVSCVANKNNKRIKSIYFLALKFELNKLNYYFCYYLQ